MRPLLVTFMLLLCLPALLHAEAFVCEVAATPGKLSRFLPSVDPSRFVAGATETCNVVQGDAATAQQIALYTTTPQKYLKTTGAPPNLLMAVMSAAEKQAVDDAIAAEQARHAAWAAEASVPNVCKYSVPADVDTLIETMRSNMQTDINSMSLSAADKQKLGNALNRVVNAIGQVAMCDAARASGGR